MKIKTEPIEVWSEYRDGVAYNDNINLYETIKRNERFMNGDQWNGVNAPDLDKPVFNILRRVGNMKLAFIMTDDIAVHVRPFYDDGTADEDMKIISNEVEKAIEYTQLKKENRDALRNGYVQGDGCIHFFFDMSKKTGTAAVGLIGAESIDNTNIFFGNPAEDKVENQPYIIVLMRRDIDEVRKEAIQNGMSELEAEGAIVPDADSNMLNEEHLNNDLVSVLVKYWKEDEHVYSCTVTREATIKAAHDTGLELYPIAFMNWEKVANSYHGQADVTCLIPNQIGLNKIFAMQMEYVKKLAFPKLIYDKNRFPKGFSNKIGEAIAVNGNVNEACTNAFRMPDLDASIMGLTDAIYKYTQETMGASDATLGNVRPENTSAIIATQNATTAPLSLVRSNFYQFVEDSVRIIIDFMCAYYGTRTVVVEKKTINEQTGAEEMKKKLSLFDFASLKKYALNLEVNIGASSYWSEIMQLQTASNLLTAGIFTDYEQYVESIPDAYLKNKGKILESIRAQKQQAQQMQTPPAAPLQQTTPLSAGEKQFTM